LKVRAQDRAAALPNSFLVPNPILSLAPCAGVRERKEIAKRKARDEQDRVRVVSVVVAARRLMERQASAEAEAEAAAKRPPRAPFEKNDRARAVQRMNAFRTRSATTCSRRATA
jgi:hypothetical protein